MEAFPNRGCFESSGRGYFAVVGRQKSLFSGVVIGPKSLFCFTLIACNFEICAAHRHAQRYTSLLMPCAHEKLNVKHHRTSPKPETHITTRERSCAGEKIEISTSTKNMYPSGTATTIRHTTASNIIIGCNLYEYVG